MSVFCIHCGEIDPKDQHCKLLASAVECLQDIAAMKTVSKRQRINSEAAITWLRAHGYPTEPGGYIPGVGFKEEK